MPNFSQIASMLGQHMHSTLSRSDVLKPLGWLIGILGTTTFGLVIGKAPDWLLIGVAVFLGLAILLYGVSYTFCLFTDRDALRSETYSLQKMAIEHGLYGDSQIGLIETEPQRSPVTVASSNDSQIGLLATDPEPLPMTAAVSNVPAARQGEP